MKWRKKKSNTNENWTESDLGNFRYFVGADFVEQLQASFGSLGLNQRAFAKKVKVSEGRISQVFNDPGNLTLDTMISWGRAAGLKTGVVLYNDGDAKNKRGPLSGGIFVDCWKKLGAPIYWPEEKSLGAVHQVICRYDNQIMEAIKIEEAVEENTASVRQCAMILNGLRVHVLQKQYSSDSSEDSFSTIN